MFTLNKFDCSSAIKGTGVRGCSTDMNAPVNVWLMERGTSFDPSTITFNEALVEGLIQDGKLVILPTHVSFANNTGESVYEDFGNTGESAFVRYSPIDFMLTYQKGVCFSNSLFSLKSKSWDMFIVDFDSGFVSRIWGEQTTTGLFKGFEINLINLDSIAIADGAVATKTNLRVQLSSKGTGGFLARKSFLVSDESVSYADFEGVNDLTLELVTPSAAGVKIKVFEGCGASTAVSSLTDADNWRAIDSTGATVDIDAVSYANGVYTLTGVGLVAGSSYQFEVYDNLNGKDIVIVGGVFYDSDPTELVTLTA